MGDDAGKESLYQEINQSVKRLDGSLERFTQLKFTRYTDSKRKFSVEGKKKTKNKKTLQIFNMTASY